MPGPGDGTHPAPSREVTALAVGGLKIKAIKLYREETGLGLAEAKAVVDGLPSHTAPSAAQPSSPQDRGSRRAAAFLAATVLGLGGVAVTGTGLYRAHVASSWPQASGQIVESRLVSGTSDRVDVEYTYEVDDRVHRGARISYTLVRGPFFTRATEARYPRGKTVTVHYDPTDPTRSVLEVRAPSPYLLVFIVSLIAFSWGVSRWIQEAQRERADRRSVSP